MPRLKLSGLNVEQLEAKHGRRTDYRDAVLLGLILRVSPTGRRTWLVEYRLTVDGRRRRSLQLLGHLPAMGLGNAREAARGVLENADRGEPPAPPRAMANVLTVPRLVEQSLAEARLRPTTRQEWWRLLRKEIEPAFRLQPAATLQRADVRAWMRSVGLHSGYTANRAFEVLRRAYSWGIAEDLIEISPCDHLRKIFEERRSERVLSAEELWALLRALDRAQRARPGYADATRLLLLTGVRRAAVIGMRRDELHDLDGEAPRWVVPGGAEGRSKSGREHVVPLVPAALEAIRRRLADAGGQHLFPVGRRRTGDDAPMTWSANWREWARRRVTRTVGALRRRARLQPEPVPRWTFHNLRHAIATHMREDLGVAPDVVSLVLGHTVAGAAVTRIYDRAARLDERRAALQAWAAWLEALRTGQVARGAILAFRGRSR